MGVHQKVDVALHLQAVLVVDSVEAVAELSQLNTLPVPGLHLCLVFSEDLDNTHCCLLCGDSCLQPYTRASVCPLQLTCN